ncbi:MAG: type II 3-dehydroquinate dehydratase [Candidatus Alcyoniella australis]|nr:type II 3-dehydroquinate dehydratase [Candidatus Alcyoniella australis]
MESVLVLNGPNLNLLGSREPELYGECTLQQIEDDLRQLGADLGVEVQCLQANGEGELIDAVQGAIGRCHALIINPGGYSHTSVALRDALAAFEGTVIEVHLTNVAAREPFRRRNITATAADGVISGLGPAGYSLAMIAVGKAETSDD